MGDAWLQIDGVAKSYGDHPALAGVSLDVRAGEICGLLGPNGAGKTTLVSIVAGLLSADSGSVTINGLDVATDGDRTRRLVGLAAQETAIYPTITVAENLTLFADLAGLRGSERRQRIDEVAEALELGEFMGRLARHLSGGEKRRLHTAMALVHRPRIVLLDEPTTGVDVTTRQRLLEAVKRMATQDGSAVVYSTHYLPEIEQLDASVVVLDHGSVLARGSVRDLIARHARSAVEITLSGATRFGADDPAGRRTPARSAGPDGSSTFGSATVETVGDTTVMRVTGESPGPLLAQVMADLGSDVEHVVGVEVITPSLEAVFLDLTGRRIDAQADPAERVAADATPLASGVSAKASDNDRSAP